MKSWRLQRKKYSDLSWHHLHGYSENCGGSVVKSVFIAKNGKREFKKNKQKGSDERSYWYWRQKQRKLQTL
ncbi:conserved hypothetical protein [Ricinus communis]|uniref:Uncharacterized protein n=1 Tax=Ricinus communis TaxID=3988 RepID=B9T0S8_RICCO|nr:conserved hypothetical protein [Ricinus communis]